MNLLETYLASNAAIAHQLTKLVESITDSNTFIDPSEPYRGPNGEYWAPVGYASDDSPSARIYSDESGLQNVRNLCRFFADENPFAINSHDNRLNYTIGWGHTYNVVAKDGEDVPEDVLDSAKAVVHEFLKTNIWSPSYVGLSQQESGRRSWGFKQLQNMLRRDRDGEVFIRKFKHEDGILRLRYIEPWAVATPKDGRIKAPFGIQTDPDDEETVLTYWVNNEPVDAAEIQHRTRNGSDRHPRGVPIHYPVRAHLVRACKILRNGSIVTEVQTAIAMIRKHAKAAQTSVTALQQSLTTVNASDSSKPRQQKYEPGTILDASAQTDYEFPQTGIDPAKYVASLAAELRAIAARLCMPEFMLTSDASNSNFASTMVAEGPAVKNFQKLQWEEISDDVALIYDALQWAAESGRLPVDILEMVEIQAEAPAVATRDMQQEAQRAETLIRNKILSIQTASAQFDLDYDQEQANIEEHDERNGTPLAQDRPQLPIPPQLQGGQPDPNEPNQDPNEGDPQDSQ